MERIEYHLPETLFSLRPDENEKKWELLRENGWKEVNVIIWGPSARLLIEDEELKKQLIKAKHLGISFEACRACSDLYGVTEELEKMDIDVKYMGQPLTQLIKEKANLITM